VTSKTVTVTIVRVGGCLRLFGTMRKKMKMKRSLSPMKRELLEAGRVAFCLC
jgi:hypothetical protein